MKDRLKKHRRSILFAVGGVLAGLVYYLLAGCPTGSCPISSSPVTSMLYMGVIGWLLSGIWGKECSGGCNM